MAARSLRGQEHRSLAIPYHTMTSGHVARRRRSSRRKCPMIETQRSRGWLHGLGLAIPPRTMMGRMVSCGSCFHAHGPSRGPVTTTEILRGFKSAAGWGKVSHTRWQGAFSRDASGYGAHKTAGHHGTRRVSLLGMSSGDWYILSLCARNRGGCPHRRLCHVHPLSPNSAAISSTAHSCTLETNGQHSPCCQPRSL